MDPSLKPQKLCSTCITDKTTRKHKPTQIAEKHFFTSYYPSSTPGRIRVKHLRPNTYIFYFAAQPVRQLAAAILSRAEAYGTLSANRGTTFSNSKGEATFYLSCPVVYATDETGEIFPRHYHYTYWDATKHQWEPVLYTGAIWCNIPSLASLEKGGVKIVDALSAQSFQERHIPGAISAPAAETYTQASMMRRLGITQRSDIGRVPIVVYCYGPTCKAAARLKTQLDALGFVNNFHYPGGLTAFFDL